MEPGAPADPAAGVHGAADRLRFCRVCAEPLLQHGEYHVGVCTACVGKPAAAGAIPLPGYGPRRGATTGPGPERL